MRFHCVRCGTPVAVAERDRGSAVRCPACGDLQQTDDTPSAGARTEAWAGRWFVALAVGLIVGVVLPIVARRSAYGWDGDGGRSRSSWEAFWLWDVLEHAEARFVIAAILPLLLGVATLIVNARVGGRRRAVALLAAATGTLFLGTLLGGVDVVRAIGRVPTVASAVVLFLSLGGIAIAVGNRLRRDFSTALTARLLAGIGGCAVCLAFLLPVGGDRRTEIVVGVLFQDDAWSRGAWPFALWALVVLAYGVLGTVGFRRGSAPGLSRATTVVGRCVLIGMPVALLLAWMIGTRGEVVVTALLLAVKLPALLYGTPGIAAVALTAWLGSALRREGDVVRPPAASFGSPSVPPAPVETLATRLARLAEARAKGLLTDTEYEAKRRQIIDSTPF